MQERKPGKGASKEEKIEKINGFGACLLTILLQFIDLDFSPYSGSNQFFGGWAEYNNFKQTLQMGCH